jgi:hypothetical protein
MAMLAANCASDESKSRVLAYTPASPVNSIPADHHPSQPASQMLSRQQAPVRMLHLLVPL